MLGKRGTVRCIDDDIQEKLSLSHRYAFLNTNLSSFLKPLQLAFLKKAQRFYTRLEKTRDIAHVEDFYEWIPECGKAGLVTRVNPCTVVDLALEPYGMAIEFMRVLATDFFDPMLAMGMGATVLAVNPLLVHHENVPARLAALKQMVMGEKVGCVCITEPERGSDAVHMLTTCTVQEDGTYLLNGTKIYQTNGPVADWAVVYATAAPDDGSQMAQFLVDTRWEGWATERVEIPWVGRMQVGQETMTDLRVPPEYVLGPPGTGRDHLFEGLNLERVGIVILNLAQAWNAVAHAAIFVNLRKQFDTPILHHQAVGFTLADLWAQVVNLTLAAMHVCELVEEKMAQHDGVLPKNLNLALVATAAQMKSQSAKLSERVCYQCANLMGGAGLCDNTLMQELLGISRVQEIGGGTRQIQQYIGSLALRQIFKML